MTHENEDLSGTQIADNLVVTGTVVAHTFSASFENVLEFPDNPRPGRVVMYVPDGMLYYSNGERWVEINVGVGGGSSYYFIPAGKTVEIDEGSSLNMINNLTLDGTIILNGMLTDNF